MPLQVGQKAPDFTLPSHLGHPVTLSSYRGTNVILAFFPLAWTPIWTNQIPSYEADLAQFTGLNAQVLGISIDHVPCLKAWAESLGGINFPLLSDFWPHGAVSEQYGVLRQKDGFTERALFVIDQDGTLCYIDVHAIDQQPDNEVLRGVLRKLQAPKPAPKPKPIPGFEDDEIPEGGIVLYCTRWCKDCKNARAWLDAHGLKYTEVDIDYNMTARNRVKQWANGNLVTPTIDFEGTIVIDYHEDQYEAAIKKIKA